MDTIDYKRDRIAPLTQFCANATDVSVLSWGDCEYRNETPVVVGTAGAIFGPAITQIWVFADQTRSADTRWTLVGTSWGPFGEDCVLGGLRTSGSHMEIHVDTFHRSTHPLERDRVSGVAVRDATQS